ncbi:MAG: hypothetical protein DA408_05050 [Bacteroidetes bacterium]|nr:MAG: hypothetical protein C7N36_11630 [Bacteroidota bacterium]PTM13827.1 MAG: hypothetical protein DA408_05050 [Bacteroidota bacterium]
MNKLDVSALMPLIVTLVVLVFMIQLSLTNNGLFLQQLLVSGGIIMILLLLRAGSSTKFTNRT